jgi:hypothetical protein
MITAARTFVNFLARVLLGENGFIERVHDIHDYKYKEAYILLVVDKIMLGHVVCQ